MPRPRSEPPSRPDATCNLAHEASSEQARVSAIDAQIDRGYGDLKHAAEADDGPHGITVRFVSPADKA